MSRRRVAVVFPEAHRAGGVERVAWELLRHLSGPLSGVAEVAFVGQRLDPPIPGVATWRATEGRGLARAPVFRARSGAVLRRMRPDRTVSFGVQCPPGDVLSVQSVHAAWLASGRPATVRGRRVPGGVRRLLPRHRVLLALERRYFRSGAYETAFALSPQVASDLREHYDVDPARIVVVPNGYAPDEFSPERVAPTREQYRERLGVADGEVALLMVANELHRKGLATALEALAGIDAPVSLHVVGRAPLDPYGPQIERLGLAGRVRWHGPTADVAPWYGAADLFVLPTQYEPFGLVIVEALACGLPVITTELAGAAPAVRPGVNGLLQHDPEDAAELRRLIEEALRPGVLDRWRAAAPGSVEAYRWPEVFSKVEHLVLGERR